MRETKVNLHANGRLTTARGPISAEAADCTSISELEQAGIGLRAMDGALLGPVLAPGAMPSAELRAWLPGALRTISDVINIDEITGVSTVGTFEDIDVAFRVVDPTARAELYGDTSNVPLADYNPSIETRAIARFELGFQVGRLEGGRQAAQGFQAMQTNRATVVEALNRARNDVGFSGLANQTTYGLLNDPNLPAYLSYADVGAGGVVWKTASYDNLVADITRMVSAIETQSGGNLDDKAPMCMVLPTGYRVIMNRAQGGTGQTIRMWLDSTYPNIRFVYTPKFIQGASSQDVAYLFVENAGAYDDSDITGATMIQAVQSRYEVIGSENRIKGYIEDAVAATAGVITLRPWAFCRYKISA